MRLIGRWQSDTEKFAAAMDMLPPTKQEGLSRYNTTIMDAAEQAAEQSAKDAANSQGKSVLGGDAALSVIANVDVSFDSSWSTRGFSSKYGFCSVISVASKQVLDYFTSSKTCSVRGLTEVPWTRTPTNGRHSRKSTMKSVFATMLVSFFVLAFVLLLLLLLSLSLSPLSFSLTVFFHFEMCIQKNLRIVNSGV